MPDIALYHPWIDPTNGTTIRTAILYWDEMRTITPGQMRSPYANDTTRIASELGFLRPFPVEQQHPHVIRASREFEQDFGRRAIRKYMKEARRRAAQDGDPPDWMGPQKVSMEFERRFFRHGTVQRDGMYGVAEGFGLPYMARLAVTIAGAEGMTAFSDQILSHDVVRDKFIFDSTDDKLAQAEAALAQFAVESLTIPSTVPLWRLWSFREKHFDELLRFRTAMKEQAIQLAGLQDPEQLYEAARRIVKNKVTPAKKELTAKFKEKGIDYSTHVMEGISAAILGYAASHNLRGALYGLGVKVVWSGVRAGIAMANANTGPMAYLLRARKQFVA